MKDKNYGLDKRPNEGVTDSAPDWMNQIFEKKDMILNTTPKPKYANPFKDINDPILNPNKKSVNTCSICGKPLNINEIDVCSTCLKK